MPFTDGQYFVANIEGEDIPCIKYELEWAAKFDTIKGLTELIEEINDIESGKGYIELFRDKLIYRRALMRLKKVGIAITAV